MEQMWVENKLQLHSMIPIVPIDTYTNERRKRYIESIKTKRFIQDNLLNQINDRIIKHKITYILINYTCKLKKNYQNISIFSLLM